MDKQTSGPMGGSTSAEMDEMKRMLLETNPILLGTTIFVSLLHSLFEFLAFKSGRWLNTDVKGKCPGVSVCTKNPLF